MLLRQFANRKIHTKGTLALEEYELIRIDSHPAVRII